jgi:hypothetical protein
MGRLNWWAPARVQRAVAKLGLYEVPGAAPPAPPPVEPSAPAEPSPASSP